MSDFTSRDEVKQLDDESSEKAAASVGQGEKVQGDPSQVGRGQLEGYEGTCQTGSDIITRSVYNSKDRLWKKCIFVFCGSKVSEAGWVSPGLH